MSVVDSRRVRSLAEELAEALQGRMVVGVRQLFPEEISALCWEGLCDPCETVVVMFDNGSAVVSMCDPEGNGPGFLELCDLAEPGSGS